MNQAEFARRACADVCHMGHDPHPIRQYRRREFPRSEAAITIMHAPCAAALDVRHERSSLSAGARCLRIRTFNSGRVQRWAGNIVRAGRDGPCAENQPGPVSSDRSQVRSISHATHQGQMFWLHAESHDARDEWKVTAAVVPREWMALERSGPHPQELARRPIRGRTGRLSLCRSERLRISLKGELDSGSGH